MAGVCQRYLPKTTPAAFPGPPIGYSGLPELGGVYILLGPPKHSKSTVILNIVEAHRDVLSTVFVLSPNIMADQTLKPLLDIAAENHEDDAQFVIRTAYSEKDFELFEAAMLSMPPLEGFQHMIIIDDAINVIKPSSPTWGILSRWRHLGATILLGTQKLKSIPKVARQMTSCYIVLGCASSELKQLEEELSPLPITQILDATKRKHGVYGWVRYLPYEGVCFACDGGTFDTSKQAVVWQMKDGDYASWAASINARKRKKRAADSSTTST